MNAPCVRPIAGLLAIALLAACQGNVGSSYPSASLPQLSPNPGQNYSSAQRQSRTIAANTNVRSDDDALDFPVVDGFGLRLVLREGGAFTPAPLGTGSPSSPGPGGTAASRTALGAQTPAPSASAPSAPAPSPSASVSPSASARPGGAAGTGTPKPAASATPVPAKAELKLTTYPDNAPELPATAGLAPRRALVRGYLVLQRDVTVLGPGAFEFVLPPAERPAGRAFTIAVYESLKHGKLKLLAQDPDAALAAERVRGAAASEGPMLLHRGRGYVAILYASDVAPLTGQTQAPQFGQPQGGFTPPPGQASPGAPAPVGTGPFASPSAAIPH